MTRTSKLPSFSFSLLAALTAVILSGCGYHVAITYLKARQPALREGSIANVYLVIHRPPILGAETVSKSGYQKEADLPVDLDSARFASKVAVYLRDRGGRLSAYRVQGAGNEIFLEALKPSSLLVVKFESPVLREEEEKEERIEGDGDKEVRKEIKHWTAKASLHVSARLLSYPDQVPWGAGQTKLESNERYDTPGENQLRSRYLERAGKLVDNAALWVVQAAVPIDIVTRTRTLYAVDSDTESVSAAKAGKRQHWQQAAPVWRRRLQSNPDSWRDAWNLGVWAEGQRDYPSARQYYQKARTSSVGDKNAPKPEIWSGVFLDCEQPLAMTITVPDSAQGWFGQRLAVLPFTDVSTSIDGPLHVRRLVREALAKSGYSAMTLEDVDAILNQHGFTQGGQLTATTPGQLSEWLKADLLLYGHLEKFDEFTLGLFGWKRVNGSFKLWSTSKKDYLWVSEKSVSRFASTTAGSWKDVGWSFLQQLVGSWADKASHKPMSEESAYYVDQQLSELPRRP